MSKKITFFIVILSTLTAFCACDRQSKVANERSNAYYADLDNQLKIIAEITLKPNAMESMRPVFEKLIAASQAEEGCIYYDLHKDMSDTTNTKYVILEIWKDQQAIDAHNESHHFKTFQQTSGDYIEDLSITVLKVSK